MPAKSPVIAPMHAAQCRALQIADLGVLAAVHSVITARTACNTMPVDWQAALAHGHRGRRPANATPDALVADVVHLACTRYAGVNHTHLAELLAEREGIHIGRTTLRRVLLEAGLSSPRRRRPPKHRVRRQRMPREGMLIQMDGSHHPWLSDLAPPFTLLIAVDDATGTALSAWFCEQEDSHNYFLLIRALVERRGVPVALYTDRHGVFKHTPGAGLPTGLTQFSRAMDELGVQMIFAQSPQAKGRVERTAGTFQDRLVAELRLAGATTLEQAQAVLDEFVPRFNRRFGVPPQCSEPAFRPLDPGSCLEQLSVLPQIKCYRSSLQSSLMADPATKPEIALHRIRKGSLLHIGGLNCASSLPLSDSC